MGMLERVYFGPADEVEVYREGGLSLPEDHPLSGMEAAEFTFGGSDSLFLLRCRDFTEADIHFLIRLIEGLGSAEGFPKVSAEKMDAFLETLKALFRALDSLKDGVQMEDIPGLVDLLLRLRSCLG